MVHTQLSRFVAALILVGSFTATSAGAAPRVAQRWAILIGIDDYANASDLQYCGADQTALRKQLLASGFPADHVFLLHDQADDNKYRPSRGNLEKQLSIVLNLAEANDLIVLSFSGHGVSLDGKSYLCPNDAVLGDPTTLVSLDGIYERLKNCAATFKLVLVDACRNDPRPGGQRSFTATPGTKALARSLQEIRLPEGVVLLNSCAPGEISWEEPDFGHGVFMHYVLEGLAGAADVGGDGNVSLHELQGYAGTKTKTYVARKFNDSQRPFFKGDLTIEALEYALLPIGPGAIPGGGGHSPNTIGMKFALIPAGEFMMGSDETLDDLKTAGFTIPPDLTVDDESPRHKVRITKPFYLGTYEVTRGQFAEFVRAESYRTEAERDEKGGWGYVAETKSFAQKPEFDWRNTGFTQTDDHPVVNVSWNDAVAFCAWLGKKEGKTYRLPTEAEWEYACRGGTTTRYFAGNSAADLEGYGNLQDVSFNAKFPTVDFTKYPSFPFDDGWAFTAPVGRFKPNGFGLHDVHGNVVEWCSDWYGADYYGKSSASDPPGPVTGSLRVFRGGGWYDAPASCRSANRSRYAPVYRVNVVGFRVALVP